MVRGQGAWSSTCEGIPAACSKRPSGSRISSVGGDLVGERRIRSPRWTWRGPLVILADEGTASGAEVIVAVLKDLDRAVVFGQRTAGVGTIQVQLVDTDPEDGRKAFLELTIGTLTRPSGPRIDGLGIVPDLSLIPTDQSGHPLETLHVNPGGWSLNPYASPPPPRPASPERSVGEVAFVWQEPGERRTPEEFLLQDLAIRLAKDLLGRAPMSRRSEMLPELERLSRENAAGLQTR
jgi:peptidase S41-like protein